MIKKAEWIRSNFLSDEICPKYRKKFITEKEIKKAEIYITAQGVYTATLNGERIGNYVLAPGWTVYEKRLQYQVYDITDLLEIENCIEVTVANGWYRFGAFFLSKKMMERKGLAIIALIHISYQDGSEETIKTDDTWEVGESELLFSSLYDGSIYDASKTTEFSEVTVQEISKDNLVLQEGEIVCEHERIKPVTMIKTPKGEIVLDFGQNMTGYTEFRVNAKCGDRVKISHAEILAPDGNFYTENYRTAKATIEYICKDGEQTYKPTHNFYGFRYIRIDEFPTDVNPDDFTAIVVHSDIKRTGYLSCGVPMLNKLFSNIIWGQKGNFLDVPTDCPQRDERLGWTGDIRAFIKTASYNFDVEKFMKKWLADMRAEQHENGLIPNVIPDAILADTASAAWGDAAVICPWQIYLTYGNKEILKDSFESMKLWINYITTTTKDEYLWTGGEHYGDWLGIDAPYGSYKGSSRDDFVASAFYAYSTSIVVEAGKVIGEDVTYFEELYKNILKTFRETFTECKTQTEHALAICFDLFEDKEAVGDSLAKMVLENGNKLTTGFVGTAYLLQALSVCGYTEIAYNLLLQTEYPSWLFSVKMGATTIWEHWDGIKEDGTIWPADMNSFNHYSFGSVADWVYEFAAGIKTVKEHPGFEKIVIEPHADKRLGHLEAKIDTKYGTVRSYWIYQQDNVIRYEISIPTNATVIIDKKEYILNKGNYIFYLSSNRE